MRVRSTQTGLILASACYLVSASAGASLAITTHLPARFAEVMHGSDVARDFLLLRGTGLSPNLAMLLGQLVLTGCVLRRDRAGSVGVAGLTVLGTAYTLGQLGEPIAREAFLPATRNIAQAAIVAVNVVFPLAMLVFGVLEWRGRARASHPRPAGQEPDPYPAGVISAPAAAGGRV